VWIQSNTCATVESLPTLTTVSITTPLTARAQLAGTAAHWGWEAIDTCCSPRCSCYRRARFRISVIFSERDSDVVYATLWLDEPTGTQGSQQRCVAVIDEGDKGHRVEVWMMMHGAS
jgi:hypothetical protein